MEAISEANCVVGNPVEIVSAFARVERENRINAQRIKQAELLLAAIEKIWAVVEPENRIIQLARTFPSVHGLRAADSIQRAAALVWCREFPKNKAFIAADEKLLKAAEGVGFTIYELA